MNSPFTNFTGQDLEAIIGTGQDKEISQSPFMDIGSAYNQLNETFYDENFMTDVDVAGEEEINWGKVLQTGGRGMGNIISQNIKGYEDPGKTGVPLIKIDSVNRNQPLSKNFTVKEFAQAGKGAHQWQYYRADMELINELQKLRDAVGRSITIVDGYYPPLYSKHVLKHPAPVTNNPHYSGRGVKIYVKGMTGQQLASLVIEHCDPKLKISVGEETIEMCISKYLERISSYIKDKPGTGVINRGFEIASDLRRLDLSLKEKRKYITTWDIPATVMNMQSPKNDFRLIEKTLEDVKKQLQEINNLLPALDQLGDASKHNPGYIVDKLDHTSNAQLIEALKKDRSGMTLSEKLQAIDSLISLAQSFHSFPSISEKIKEYDEIFKNKKLAAIYASTDLAQTLSSIISETINLLIAIGCTVIKDPGTLSKLLSFSEKFGKATEVVGIGFQGLEVIKSLVKVIYAYKRSDEKAVSDEILNLTTNVINLLASFAKEPMAGAVFSYYFFMFRFFKDELPGMIHGMNIGLSRFATFNELKEIETNFADCTYNYVYSKYDNERIDVILKEQDFGSGISSWPQQLRTDLFRWGRDLFTAINKFRDVSYGNYDSLSEYPQRKKLAGVLYSRIFEDKRIAPKYDYFNQNGVMSWPDEGHMDLDHIYFIQRIYELFHELIVQCYLDIDVIAEKRYSINSNELEFDPGYELPSINNEAFDFFAPEGDPVLFYEDVTVKTGETLIGLAAEYGFDPDDWREIWYDAKNAALAAKRKLSTSIREGDIIYIPIKWRIIDKSLIPFNSSFKMSAQRNGKEGLRLDWVQTVFADNQPDHRIMRKPFPAFSVDWPLDDDFPFYWMQVEYDHNPGLLERDCFKNAEIFRTKIMDCPDRDIPKPGQSMTGWRAVTSLCVRTHKRVSIWDTFVWGINFNVDGSKEAFKIRAATNNEINGHLNLLRKKNGRSHKSFTSMGWTFRDRNKPIA